MKKTYRGVLPALVPIPLPLQLDASRAVTFKVLLPRAKHQIHPLLYLLN